MAGSPCHTALLATPTSLTPLVWPPSEYGPEKWQAFVAAQKRKWSRGSGSGLAAGMAAGTVGTVVAFD